MVGPILIVDYREAVLLASLLWKKDWKKQSQLVRKWGEHCAENSEGPLAARWSVCQNQTLHEISL